MGDVHNELEDTLSKFISFFYCFLNII